MGTVTHEHRVPLVILGRIGPWAGRLSIGAVWLYQGLWNKLLARSAHQAAIISAVAGPSSARRVVLAVLGVAEVLLSTWVIAGWRPRACAGVQTVVLIAMNTGGLLWARDQIPDPGAMIVQNVAFLLLVWLVAQDMSFRHVHPS